MLSCGNQAIGIPGPVCRRQASWYQLSTLVASCYCCFVASYLLVTYARAVYHGCILSAGLAARA